MIELSDSERRQAFSIWLRTGRPPNVRTDGVELKFNPYHDPRNGLFTLAPGGIRSLDRVVISHRREVRAVDNGKSDRRPGTGRSAETQKAQSQVARGFLSRRVDDLLTLKHAIPTLSEAIGGATFVIPEKVFERGQQLVDDAALQAERIVDEVRNLVPASVVDKMDLRPFIDDARERLQDVRLVRAAAYMRFMNDLQPMQIETARVMQDTADAAYDEGDRLIRSGRLRITISRELTLGNYVDAKVRKELRKRYKRLEINEADGGFIRVNRREAETAGDERLYRRPDARVGDIAYDVTLTQKTLKTPQVRGYFRSDFKPRFVIIIRPRQIDAAGSYIIVRPEKW